MRDINVSEYQLDALKEHLNIGVGWRQALLAKCFRLECNSSVPKIQMIDVVDFLSNKEFDDALNYATVTMPFSGNVSGRSSVVFYQESAAKLVNILIPNSQDTSEELNDLTESTLTEVGNIIINAVMGQLSNLCNMQLSFSPPTFSESDIKGIITGNLKDGAQKNSSVILLDRPFC